MEEAEREFRESIIPTAEALQALGLRYPVVIGRIGAEYHAWAVEQFSQLEAELLDDEPR